MASFRDHITMLHTAIKMGQMEYIKTHLKRSPSIHDYELLHIAVSCDQVDMARYLITKCNFPVDYRNKKKQSSLHIACSKGYLSMAKMLIVECKANLALRDADNDTPLFEAAKYGQIEIVSVSVVVIQI